MAELSRGRGRIDSKPRISDMSDRRNGVAYGELEHARKEQFRGFDGVGLGRGQGLSSGHVHAHCAKGHVEEAIRREARSSGEMSGLEMEVSASPVEDVRTLGRE